MANSLLAGVRKGANTAPKAGGPFPSASPMGPSQTECATGMCHDDAAGAAVARLETAKPQLLVPKTDGIGPTGTESMSPESRVSDEDQRELDQAFDGLERETPDRVSRMIRWLRDPASRWVRIPLGILLILQSVVFFLPVAGIEFLPLGLLLIAQDVPFLKKPVARLVIWLEAKWRQFRNRRKKRG